MFGCFWKVFTTLGVTSRGFLMVFIYFDSAFFQGLGAGRSSCVQAAASKTP